MLRSLDTGERMEEVNQYWETKQELAPHNTLPPKTKLKTSGRLKHPNNSFTLLGRSYFSCTSPLKLLEIEYNALMEFTKGRLNLCGGRDAVAD